MGFVKSPWLGSAHRAPGNHPGEDHILLQIPVRFRRFGVAEYRDDFSAHLRWQGREHELMFGGGPRPESHFPLRRTRARVVLVAVRSLTSEVGENGVRLATEPSDLRVDAPPFAARLLDVGAIWNMRSPRVDFPPGSHGVDIEIRYGASVVHCARYRLQVPKWGEDNGEFSLELAQ
jgi:hypothetical protein